MTAATHRRTVDEMEKRLADARALIEKVRDGALADMRRQELGTSGHAFEHGTSCGLDQALAFLTACFDDPERDWMYRL